MSKLTNKQLDYETFVEKFKPRKTTDDCFTPPEVYDVIRDWVCEEYSVDPASIVRPFWPGGDYQAFEYPDGCAVVDNPPFSQLVQICRFYLRRRIPFFLFAPSLMCLSGKSTVMNVNHIITDCAIVYANGAEVRTSFVTSFGRPEVYRTSPELTKRVNAISDELRNQRHGQLPKYSYPDHVLTAAMGQKYAKYGIEFVVHDDECEPIAALDSQKDVGKRIFGDGLLLNEAKAAERAAAERAAAERAAARQWQLSERERKKVARIGKNPKVNQMELFEE